MEGWLVTFRHISVFLVEGLFNSASASDNEKILSANNEMFKVM